MLGNMTEEGESPVYEIKILCISILSTTGHEKSGWNPGGPPSKAKYSTVTDREEVP